MKDTQETPQQRLARLRSKLYAIRYGKRPKNRASLKRSLCKEIELAMKVDILGRVLKFPQPTGVISKSLIPKEFEPGGFYSPKKDFTFREIDLSRFASLRRNSLEIKLASTL